jgi:rubrerythrin
MVVGSNVVGNISRSGRKEKQPMEDTIRGYLEGLVSIGGQAYVRNLAAAEAAVQRGQFNVAKVLRAMAHTQRTQALAAARLLVDDLDPDQLFATVGAELAGSASDLSPGIDPATAVELDRLAAVGHRAADLARRAGASLQEHADVPESDIAQTVWACYSCGNLIEDVELPDSCAVCGAPALEFEPYGPFYLWTAEHLGQHTPAGVIANLAAQPGAAAAAIAGIDEATLARKPSADDWSAKEILGHLIEVDVLFASRLKCILDAGGQAIPGLDRLIPWKLHEGVGYDTMPTATILDRLREVRAATLLSVRKLTPAQWGWRGTIAWRVPTVRNPGIWVVNDPTILDLGTWVVNHDRGHLAQIRHLCRRALDAPGSSSDAAKP